MGTMRGIMVVGWLIFGFMVNGGWWWDLFIDFIGMIGAWLGLMVM
jgi:hypothetical protein